MGTGGRGEEAIHCLSLKQEICLSLTHPWILLHYPQRAKLVRQEKASKKLIFFLEIIQNISTISEIILLILLNSKKVYHLCFTLF